MDFQKYLNMENSVIPAEIAETLVQPGANTITPFEDKNMLLTDHSLRLETGFSKMENGNYFVSMYCYMPGMTADMVNWWFWWHPQEDIRYQLWYPGEHFEIGYAKKDKDYFNAPEMPPFQSNTQYPVENIGRKKMPLSISFVTPEEFGFSKELMEQNNVATIICGHVGAFKGIVQHTEMCHICFQQEDGLLMVSRFWMGQRLKNPLLRKKILSDDSGRGMATHCCVEYRNFAKKIPLLYEEYLRGKK